MNKTVYTAIFGPYDDLKDPLVITPGWQYICYTDQPLQSDVWKIEHREMLPEGACRTARYYKIMFHRHIETELSIWIDASFQINTNLDEWMDKYFKEPFTCIKHPVRNCVYTEGAACIKRGKDAPQVIRKQLANYRRISMPARNGLIASGIIMRKMSQQSIDLSDSWYQQVQLYSSRDQIGFAYASWHRPMHHVAEWDYRNAKEFIHVPHLHKRIVL